MDDTSKGELGNFFDLKNGDSVKVTAYVKSAATVAEGCLPELGPLLQTLLGGPSLVYARFGIVVQRSAAVYIVTIGNLVKNQKDTGVLRCSKSTMRRFSEQGVSVQMWDTAKTKRTSSVANPLHAFMTSGATCVISVPIVDQRTAGVNWTTPGRIDGVFTAGWTSQEEGNDRQLLMQSMAAAIAPGFASAFRTLEDDLTKHFLPYLRLKRLPPPAAAVDSKRLTPDDDGSSDADANAAAHPIVALTPADAEEQAKTSGPHVPALFSPNSSDCASPLALRGAGIRGQTNAGTISQLDCSENGTGGRGHGEVSGKRGEDGAGANRTGSASPQQGEVWKASASGGSPPEGGPVKVRADGSDSACEKAHTLVRRTARGAASAGQDPLWLTFKDSQLEDCFKKERAAANSPVDFGFTLFGLLIHLALWRDPVVISLPNGCPLINPLSFLPQLIAMTICPAWYLHHRELLSVTVSILITISDGWLWTSYVASPLASAASIHSAALRFLCLEPCIQATVCVGQKIRFRTAALVRSPALIIISFFAMRSVGSALTYSYASHVATCGTLLANIAMMLLVRRWEKDERIIFLASRPQFTQ